jgi:hypothetical protein
MLQMNLELRDTSSGAAASEVNDCFAWNVCGNGRGEPRDTRSRVVGQLRREGAINRALSRYRVP